ncbi:MAG TPA: sugar MFS transporter [Balneolales bacterium]|nr:sugar MFS transporter [Balneolales bacterium]
MNQKKQSNTLAFSVVTFIFFMWGFLTVMNDVLIPHLKSLFHLSYAAIMLIQFMFFLAYFIMSMPSGKIVSLTGYKNSIIIGLVVTGIGALLFYPAAAIPSYGLFLTAFFILASGITLLQVAANPYVSLLGPEKTAASRLNLSQAFNSLGTMIAGPLGSVLILSVPILTSEQFGILSHAKQLAYQVEQAHTVQGPYIAFAIILFLCAVGMYLFHLPSVVTDEDLQEEQEHKEKYSFTEALKHKHLLFGVIAIFVYVGAEVSIGSFMVNFISQPQIGHITESTAAKYLSFYWGGAMVGRFIGSALMQKLDSRKLLGIFSTIATALVVITILTTGKVAMWAILSVGLFNSIQFPTIFTLGIERMGKLTDKASSLLIMAIVGGALIPLLQGVLADNIGIHYAYVLPVLCYLYIMFYGFKGSKIVPHPETSTSASTGTAAI